MAKFSHFSQSVGFSSVNPARLPKVNTKNRIIIANDNIFIEHLVTNLIGL
jgi:hypothetical protein